MGIVLQFGDGGAVDGDQTGPVAFGMTNRKQVLLQVHVMTIQANGFSHPQARGGQESEQSGSRRASEMLGRIKLPGGSDQAADLLIAVKVGSLSMIAVRK